MKKYSSIIVILLVVFGAAVGQSFKKWQAYERGKDKNFNDKIAALQRQISALAESLSLVSSSTPEAVLPQKEVIFRETIREKSQDQLLTEAVAKNAPAVVSIVISKDVPQLEVVYENPFGDDPFFKDFGFLVPRYRQKRHAEAKGGSGHGLSDFSRRLHCD